MNFHIHMMNSHVKKRTLFTLASLALGGASMAQAASNQVFVVQDSQGRDKSIAIRIDNVADSRALIFALGQKKIAFTSDKQQLAIQCSSTENCTVTYSDQERSYRQRFDEAVRIYDLDRAIGAQIVHSWKGPVTFSSCLESNCREFQHRRYVTTDGRFELSCNVKIKTDGSATTTQGPYCQARFMIYDLLR